MERLTQKFFEVSRKNGPYVDKENVSLYQVKKKKYSEVIAIFFIISKEINKK